MSSAVRAIELAREKPEHHVLYVSVLETIGETERAREHLRTWLPRFSTHQGLKVLAGRLEVKVPGSE